MDESKTLLACPFCGKPARLIDPETGYHDVEEWTAICEGCGARRGGDYKEDAIGAWNQRAGAPTHGATDGSRLGAVSWLDGESVRAAISAEPELPGDMPEKMWAAVKDDRDAAVELLRIVVRLTKDGISKRLGLKPSNE